MDFSSNISAHIHFFVDIEKRYPFRGEENSPKYIPLIAKEIANIKDITYDDIVEATSKNALEIFNI